MVLGPYSVQCWSYGIDFGIAGKIYGKIVIERVHNITVGLAKSRNYLEKVGDVWISFTLGWQLKKYKQREESVYYTLKLNKPHDIINWTIMCNVLKVFGVGVSF